MPAPRSWSGDPVTNQSCPTARFIIRFWLEPNHNGHGCWRGQVESVPEQETLSQQAYFEDGVTLLAFLRSCLHEKGSVSFPDLIDRR